MFNLKFFKPAGLVRLREYRQRLQALQLPPKLAWSQKYRAALDSSNIELLPRERLSALKLVVDVGAHIGLWSTGLALLCNVGKIIAYEPVPRSFQRLQENAKNFPQMVCVNAAVGATVGQISMNVEEGRNAPLSSVLRLRDPLRVIHKVAATQPRQISVPLTTLDHDLRDYEEISLLKIDVQGFDAEVLAGARETLKRTKILLIEVVFVPYYHGDTEFADLFRLITSLGDLKLWGISKPNCSPSGRPLWADAVFVAREIAAF
jgi:FkbM family methyltransferase